MEMLVIDKVSRNIIYQTQHVEQSLLKSTLGAKYLIINKRLYESLKDDRVLDFDRGILSIVVSFIRDYEK